jgi:UDP:flavonoid glycosyltransferase YjiC (YdhE family)
VTTGRYVLCSTPNVGHTTPLLALSRRLVADGHEVVFFTTEHYREKAEATGARFVPFASEYDAHDLMAVNADREAAARRGIRGLKQDLRQIFLGPITGQSRDLGTILDGMVADAVVVDCMFFGVLPLALRARRQRPLLACVGVMPLTSSSRDTAPFGSAMLPGKGSLARLRNRVMNWTGEHMALRDMQRLARRAVAGAGGPSFSGSFVDIFPKVADVFFQAGVVGFEYPRTDLEPTIKFVGPILPLPSATFDPPTWWPELSSGRPVVHVTQGTLDNADLSRLLRPTIDALAHDDLLVVATTGGPDPGPVGPLPDNVRLERFIPHDQLLPHVDVMVTNGGYGGVQQALANGVPLVVAGNSEDKPEVAARVRWSGAGIDLGTGKPHPRAIGRAVRRVLAEPAFGQRARALQSEIVSSRPLDEICAHLARWRGDGA